MKNQNILIYGTGISGIAAIISLSKLGNNVFVFDDKKSIKELNNIKEIKNVKFQILDIIENSDLKKIDIIVKSPSVPMDSKTIIRALEKNIPVVSDIEMAYNLTSKDFVVITGTNGKTTTTTLVHKIISDNNIKAGLTGNIGSGILSDIFEEKNIFVVEGSSYQLESTYSLKPKVAVITNITPDHLNWHGNFDKYINAKLNICKNQDRKDFAVLNYEDKVIRENLQKIKSKIIFFSSKKEIDEGIFIKNKKIVYKTKSDILEIIKLEEINIPGEHNLENIMASIGVAIALKLSLKKLRNSIIEFKGVEHRLELVHSSIEKVNFYNDSKGTNPDSTIKAVQALKDNIVIILGGYNKESDFSELIMNFKNKVKYAVVMGETKNLIIKSLDKYNFKNYKVVDSLEEAVNVAYNNSDLGDKILLSPACASWDMYNSFEERGKHFKEIISALEKEDIYGKNQ
ncbi:MAG: UDP-N-acetylmuramoyl-L-alanine--D-glutamate ligase [Eubacteriales bacterium]